MSTPKSRFLEIDRTKIGPGVSAQSPGQPLRSEGVHRYWKRGETIQFTADYAGWCLVSPEVTQAVFGYKPDTQDEMGYGSKGTWFGIQRLHTMLVERGWALASETPAPEQDNQADFSSASVKRNEEIVARLEALVKDARTKALCGGYTEQGTRHYLLPFGVIEDLLKEDS